MIRPLLFLLWSSSSVLVFDSIMSSACTSIHLICHAAVHGQIICSLTAHSRLGSNEGIAGNGCTFTTSDDGVVTQVACVLDTRVHLFLLSLKCPSLYRLSHLLAHSITLLLPSNSCLGFGIYSVQEGLCFHY